MEAGGGAEQWGVAALLLCCAANPQLRSRVPPCPHAAPCRAAPCCAVQIFRASSPPAVSSAYVQLQSERRLPHTSSTVPEKQSVKHQVEDGGCRTPPPRRKLQMWEKQAVRHRVQDDTHRSASDDPPKRDEEFR
ncbi:hypothetical protein NDU88_002578 [Pleurodeles waltl]|uniref:Secreted protein n=1 Tax=Pleurodeles waltl TaxID=8319 RepID=A0AAV7MXV2_PLEWA|nr:hypothetical protein NDU88_002578 [Pleurodeles waltl]